ncbi:MAG: N-acetylmuramoyl-L-alanine amidase [Deltaproteobacteria bacterium]|nr:N-acetylmuramoyl-L-alanine amidase [Deltaproteobacteria bacterium]
MSYLCKTKRLFQFVFFVFILCLAGALYAKSLAYLSPLGKKPDWSELENYQETWTKEAFRKVLEDIYAPEGASQKYISIYQDYALIQKFKDDPQEKFKLKFAKSSSNVKKASPKSLVNKPLNGLKIALDPGHIGGKWAKEEGRWFKIETGPYVAEGEMTLAVAKLLKEALEKKGAQVVLLRNKNQALSPYQPQDLKELALQTIQKNFFERQSWEKASNPEKEKILMQKSRALAYQTAEIRERAKLINDLIKPDLTICLHFDAESWGDIHHPRMVNKNYLHLIINGSYLEEELAYDDIRFEMLKKLLSQSYEEELALSKELALSLAKETDLPPYIYLPNPRAKAMTQDGYVWARNLLANRLYQGPVLYLEPYVMNSQEFYERIKAGEYAGKQLVYGKSRKSLFKEYVDGVVQGLTNYYLKFAKAKALDP